MGTAAEMMKGTVVPVTLKLLSERAMYGYEIIQEVNDRTDGVLAWQEATLYPWLHRLERDGLLKSEWRRSSAGRRRRYYLLTRRGKAELATRVGEWQAVSTAVTALLCSHAPA